MFVFLGNMCEAYPQDLQAQPSVLLSLGQVQVTKEQVCSLSMQAHISHREYVCITIVRTCLGKCRTGVQPPYPHFMQDQPSGVHANEANLLVAVQLRLVTVVVVVIQQFRNLPSLSREGGEPGAREPSPCWLALGQEQTSDSLMNKEI